METYKNFSYEKLLLDGLRMVPYKEGTETLTNERLVKAVTLNENLKTLGYTLKPDDVVKIAASPSIDTLYDDIKSQMSDVKAKPMYPDFPKQVMNMDEAQFRFHQMLHYFSTYGVEAFTGTEVSRGWLPADAGLVSDTDKTENDTRLLEAKTIELVEEKDKYKVPFERIISKNERMTDMESEIVYRCAASKELPFDEKIHIPFKENTERIFCCIAEGVKNGDIDRDTASNALYNICQHPGDVTRGIHKYLLQNGYKLHTTEKKMFVNTYEKYSRASFAENVSVSNKKAQFTKEIFKRIDFSKYAHDQKKIEAVRNIGKTHTWEAQARRKIENKERDAIEFTAKRPGMLIRMTSMALRNGYPAEQISKALEEHSSEFSMQTAVSLLNKLQKENKHAVGYTKTMDAIKKEIFKLEKAINFGTEKPDILTIRLAGLGAKARSLEEKENERLTKKNETKSEEKLIFENLIKARMKTLDTGIREKKVFLDENAHSFSNMPINPAEKEMSQGYLPSATVVKIPENVKRVRFFVYWNDIERVDIDLHSAATTKDGQSVHIGWDGGFDDNGIAFSGDITHSNAAEYIDVDLEKTNVAFVKMSVDSFTRQRFSKIDTCFVGMMAVDRIGETVKLYDPANCFFSNDIKSDSININYGEIDVENKLVRYIGKEQERENMYEPPEMQQGMLSLKDYLLMLADAQDATIVETPEEADVVLTLCKPANEKEVSLIDNNFFLDAPIEKEEKIIEKQAQKNKKETINVEDVAEPLKTDTVQEQAPETKEAKKVSFSIEELKSAKSIEELINMAQTELNAASTTKNNDEIKRVEDPRA